METQCFILGLISQPCEFVKTHGTGHQRGVGINGKNYALQ